MKSDRRLGYETHLKIQSSYICTTSGIERRSRGGRRHKAA